MDITMNHYLPWSSRHTWTGETNRKLFFCCVYYSEKKVFIKEKVKKIKRKKNLTTILTFLRRASLLLLEQSAWGFMAKTSFDWLIYSPNSRDSLLKNVTPVRREINEDSIANVKAAALPKATHTRRCARAGCPRAAFPTLPPRPVNHSSYLMVYFWIALCA